MPCVRQRMLALPTRGPNITVIRSPDQMMGVCVLYPPLSSWVTLAKLFISSKAQFFPSVKWRFIHLTIFLKYILCSRPCSILVPENTTVNKTEKNPCLYPMHILDQGVKQERKEGKRREEKRRTIERHIVCLIAFVMATL